MTINKINTYLRLIKIMMAFTFILSVPLLKARADNFSCGASKVADENTIIEGPISKVVLTAGPFDIHRRYLSMEGPWTVGKFTSRDMLVSQHIDLPESMVCYLENGGKPALMMATSAKDTVSQLNENASPVGLVHVPNENRELYWFKGVKLEVLDENGIVQPTAEFICHWNLDVDPSFRNRAFINGHPTQNPRLSSVSQAETLQILPAGFGVPIASDEPLNISFQAANRTTDVHRRIRHHCTLYFIKDKDLKRPIKALYFQVPYMTVVIDKNVPDLRLEQKKSCPVCVGTSVGMDAPNDKIGGTFPDDGGRILSGHWVIPPGIHTYRDPITDSRDIDFQKGSPVVRAAWTHVHPLCSKLSLVECTKDKRKIILSTDCKTKTSPGLQIMQLDFLTPKGGVKLHESSQYELEVTYNNTLPTAVDSMASMGIYMEDPNFVKPKWAGLEYVAEENSIQPVAQKDREVQMSCAVSNACHTQSKTISQEIMQLPLFDKSKDGPLLSEVKTVKLETNAGPITLLIDPSLAPMTATQMFRLLSSGAFTGTRIFQYEPNFLLRVESAEYSTAAQPHDQLKPLLRRIPLEVLQQKDVGINHSRYALSMARYKEEEDSATTSFCIMLNDAPQLDHQYAIFGKTDEDSATLETLAKIEKNWTPDKYWITNVKVVNNIASFGQ